MLAKDKNLQMKETDQCVLAHFRMLVPMVDTIFADVAQPDQARIVAINAHHFLKTEGHFVISIKVSRVSFVLGGKFIHLHFFLRTVYKDKLRTLLSFNFGSN